MSSTDKEKLSLGVTVKNAWYAMALASQICPGIIVHSFFLWVIGHGEWVFFDGVFMRVIVNDLDKDLGFDHIIRFIIIKRRAVQDIVIPMSAWKSLCWSESILQTCVK